MARIGKAGADWRGAARIGADGRGLVRHGRQITETGKYEHHPPRPRSRHPLRTLAGHRRRTQRRHPRQGRTANPLLLRLWRPSLGRTDSTAERSQQILRLLGKRAPRGVHEAQSCATEEFQRMSSMGGGNLLLTVQQNDRCPPFSMAGVSFNDIATRCSRRNKLQTRPPFYGAGLPLTRSLSKKTAPPFCPRQSISFLKWSGRSNRRGHPTPRCTVCSPA
jgi:hypothetical protein